LVYTLKGEFSKKYTVCEIIFYTIRRGDSPVEEYIETLPDRIQSKIAIVLGLLKQQGPNLTRLILM